jgi:DNA-binding SARP family transcriptional activator
MAERDGRVVDEKRLPGRQGPMALVYLGLERARPVPIGELAHAVWGENLPRAWETALSAIVSKLRSALAPVGLDARRSITTVSGRARQTLRSVRVRAMSCLASVALANMEWPLAAQFARTQVEMEPLPRDRLAAAHAGARGRGQSRGGPAGYAECRELLAKEMGIAPSPETEAIVQDLRTR